MYSILKRRDDTIMSCEWHSLFINYEQSVQCAMHMSKFLQRETILSHSRKYSDSNFINDDATLIQKYIKIIAFTIGIIRVTDIMADYVRHFQAFIRFIKSTTKTFNFIYTTESEYTQWMYSIEHHIFCLNCNDYFD